MKDKMAVITKRAYNARHIGTIELSEKLFDDKDSGWRLFYGDEDDHVLDRMECFRIVTLDEALSILPQLENIIYSKDAEHTYYHVDENGNLCKSDCFESETEEVCKDPFLKAFMNKSK